MMGRTALRLSTALSLSVSLIAVSPAIAQTAQEPVRESPPQSPQQPAQQPAPAQDDAAQEGRQGEWGGIQDIVVTAQRRNESAQEVPIAISAFAPEQLESLGVSNTLDLGQFVPNMVAQNNTGLGSANAFYLRGLGNSETLPTFDPPVGTYVDDIYISRQNANNLSLFDVERVEVLRGPQGTLFGRNTTGGAINVILRQPRFDRIGGYAEIGFGSYGKKIARASVDVPLADSFAIKLSGYYQDDDGYARNTTTGERVNDDDGWGVRLGMRGDMAPWARWHGSYAYIEANGENMVNYDCDPRNPTDCDGRFVTTGLRKDAGANPYAPLVITGRKAQYGMGNYTQSHLVTSNLAFDLAPATTLSFITGYIAQGQQYAIDFADGRALPGLSNPNPAVRGDARGGFTILLDGYSDQFSQEVKLNASLGDGLFDFVTGGFYLNETSRTDFADMLTVAPGATLLLADRLLRTRTEAIAGYFQGDLNLTDWLTLTAGIRYTDERKSISLSDNRAQCNTGGAVPATCLTDANLIAPSGVRIPQDQRAKLWTPRFAVNVKASDDVLLFASATRGFKSGGWNSRGTAPNTFLPFGPEKVWSYEAGIKSDLFDRRVRANVTIYLQETQDLQTPSALVAPTGAITFLARNFADYRNKGVEFELTFAPTSDLNFYLNGGYQDDEYIIDRSAPDFDIYGIQSVAAQQAACQALLAAGLIPGGTGTAPCAAGIVTARGEISTPVRTPDWTLSMGGSYRFRFANGMSLVPAVNASWRSDQEVQTSNYSIYSGSITGTNGTYPANPYGGDLLLGSFSPASWLVNTSLALNGADDKWQLSAGCTNCFDVSFAQSALANVTYINQPRMWTVRGKVNF